MTIVVEMTNWGTKVPLVKESPTYIHNTYTFFLCHELPIKWVILQLRALLYPNYVITNTVVITNTPIDSQSFFVLVMTVRVSLR